MRYAVVPILVATLGFACGPKESHTTPPQDTPGPDTNELADTVDTVDTPAPSDPTGLPAGLVGHPPAQPVPATVFTAHNYDNTLRNKDSLLGHPTVVWFFPATGTPG